MSGKVSAMSEKIENPTKTEQINTEKTTEKNESVVQRLATVLMGALRDTTDIVNEYKDTLSQYVDNPFVFYAESNVVQFKIELETPVKLPKYISSIIFGAELTVNAIEINGHDITLYFAENSELERYIIELDNEKTQLMDLVLLIYVLNNMSYNNQALFSLYLQTYRKDIEQEKNELLKMLKSNGIEINN